MSKPPGGRDLLQGAWRSKVPDSLRDDASFQTDSETDPPVAPPPEGPVSLSRIRYRVLAVLWVPVSLGALFLLGRDDSWRTAQGLTARLEAVRIEQWTAVLLLGFHGWFLVRARGSGTASRGGSGVDP